MAEQWPEFKAQQRLQAARDPAELAAAQQRCQTLLQHGYGPLEDWLLSDPTEAERQAMRRQREGQPLAFD